MSDQPLSELAAEIAELEARIPPPPYEVDEDHAPCVYADNECIADFYHNTSADDPVAKSTADYLAACANANVGRRLAEAAAEIDRLRHLMECADTPLMRDVMAERNDLLAACQLVLSKVRTRLLNSSDPECSPEINVMEPLVNSEITVIRAAVAKAKGQTAP